MTWIQTEQGRAFNLIEPDWREVDFDEMANSLARQARFTGHVSAGAYSIAQHLVVGADIVFRDTGKNDAAANFLLHDGEEYVIGDEATPKAMAEIEIARQMYGEEFAKQFRAVKRELKRRVEVAVYRAAGLTDYGCDLYFRDLVHEYDLRMLLTERLHLLGKPPRPWAPEIERLQPLRLPYPLQVWPWPKAADEFRERLRRYLPERFGPARANPKSGPRRDGARPTRHLQEA
ncbi:MULTISPECIES: hypothetical protein [unclassified Bosea (in: a-proteobacteria)]|uniref:hypothetical protein n=1 Tax=unclassified Bosea (in: a-proteobacteria) TaxID=2653178 RepID=UPI000F75B164|nr:MULTISPECIES: hypothetical protein [unclassified Bosea (in: a-proteobacteria)]AZO77747.1 hypothetical protein BLM15_09040 [Bosea sp. Tri-49]RXT18361.1 hypothetical protein B5U98_24195 [Bosea sp. Tri-39]RXT32957.1 hypothetical protein B5U99_30540 [Bosea sp. Tri-54]